MLRVLLAMALQSAGAIDPGAGTPIPAIITNPDWVQRPTNDDLLGFYPRAAQRNGVEGAATISCHINAQGQLVNCQALSEQPLGAGFGAAAVSMASKFRMRPTTRDGAPVEGGKVQIPIQFRLPAMPDRSPSGVIMVPLWLRQATLYDVDRVYPEGARKHGVSGAAVMTCQVTAKGRLSDCRVADEAPDGEGFGEAALKLSDKFTMRPQTLAGSSVEGGTVKIPIRFIHPSKR